ncbi:MAG: HdeD family acid-resistance protein [Mangrovicoccus sp.]
MNPWIKWLLLGLLSIAFGAFVLSNTVIASVSVTLMIGVLFLVSGGFQLAGAVTDYGFGNKLWGFLLAALMIFLGASFIKNPLEGTVTLSLVVTATIAAAGVTRLFLAWQMRKSAYFWAMLVSGAFSILLAGLIFADWEIMAASILGLLLGVELVLNGVGLVVLGLFMRTNPELAAKIKAAREAAIAKAKAAAERREAEAAAAEERAREEAERQAAIDAEEAAAAEASAEAEEPGETPDAADDDDTKQEATDPKPEGAEAEKR